MGRRGPGPQTSSQPTREIPAGFCACEVGIASLQRELPAGATQTEVERVVDELNNDPSCTAFLVQQPTGLDEFAILSRVDPVKDVDGLHPFNLGSLVLGRAAPLPCTPLGIIELLRRYDVTHDTALALGAQAHGLPVVGVGQS